MTQRIDVPGMGVVEFPDGMSDADMTAAIKRSQAPKLSAGRRFAEGLADPVHGGAELLTKMLPASLVERGNQLNNWLADKTGLVARLPDGGVPQQVAQREADLRAGAPEGIDWARLGGNMASPVNIGLASLAPARAASLAGRMAQGAGVGAAAASLNPVGNRGEDFTTEKLKQMGLGAAGGAAIPAIAAGVGRVISPKASTNPQLALLMQDGVRPTIGQSLGGAANKIEEKAMSLPIMGDAIAAARRRAEADLGNAVANRSLAPIGQKAEGVGRELVADAQKKLSDAYESLLPKLTWRPDGQFAQQALGLQQMVNTGAMKPEAVQAFNRILQNEVIGKMGAQNAMTGQTFKAVEANLGAQIRRLGGAQDADQRLLGDALKELQSAMRGALQRSNPQATELKAINEGWANFKRLERAASYVGAQDGAFSAANLQTAVKALDRSKDHGKFARGDAFMQDLSDPAKAILGNKVPDSGTAGRLFMGAGALASGAASPAIPAALAGGAIAYSPPAQALLRGLLTQRPAAAQPVASLLNQASPMFGPAGGLLGLEMFKQ